MERERIIQLVDTLLLCITNTMEHSEFESGTVTLKFMDGAVAVENRLQCSDMLHKVMDSAITKTAPILGALLMLNKISDVEVFCEKDASGKITSHHTLKEGGIDKEMVQGVKVRDEAEILRILDKYGLGILKNRLDDKVLCYPVIASKYADKPEEELEWLIKNI